MNIYPIFRAFSRGSLCDYDYDYVMFRMHTSTTQYKDDTPTWHMVKRGGTALQQTLPGHTPQHCTAGCCTAHPIVFLVKVAVVVRGKHSGIISQDTHHCWHNTTR